MKFGVALSVLAALLIGPVACVFAICDFAHADDCCPKPKAFVACPLDVLWSAKSVPMEPAVDFPVESAPVIAVRFEPVIAPDVLADQSDIHIFNRVLRI